MLFLWKKPLHHIFRVEAHLENDNLTWSGFQELVMMVKSSAAAKKGENHDIIAC